MKKSNFARIDTHHHIVPSKYSEWLNNKGVPAIPEWSSETSLDMMGKNQIETAILSVTTPGVEPGGSLQESRKMARELNEYCAQVVSDNPGRFGFWATLTLPDVDGALSEAAYALDELNADGIVLLANSKGTYLGDPLFDPLLEELNRRHTVVFVHPSALAAPPVPGIPAYVSDFLLDTTRAATNMVVNGTLERFPNIKIILSHGGGFIPYAADRIGITIEQAMPEKFTRDGVINSLKRFYFDTALTGATSALPSLLTFADPSRITFGSDFPYAVSETATWFTQKLDNYKNADHHAINRGNAEALFPRLA
ncbi:putative TIM-barrel fold metal-dependent hydrolase [Neobacillus niacini]|uniref:amidohydrolase family protein n=1 Tax=Neobacillus niacini TaxID=86668 RepID=UPI00286374B3|nr:amidohydrolase family protein [Neobacillus niacini]MDR7080214.1 putative TIM-barrel fold metal-dependent hydrolase [Neobacillus niacini]